MRNITPYALSLLLSAQSLFAGEFIRQQQLDSGLTWDYYVSSTSGSAWSPIAVGKDGSSFSLFARGTQTDTHLYKLDESTLGSDYPTADIVVKSEDPHYPPRTRADKPYTLTLDIKNTAGKNNQIALRHQGTTYQPKTHTPAPQAPSTGFGWWNLTNGKQKASFFPRIPSPDPTQAEGEETFTAYTRSKDGSSWLPLKTTSIQVWPVAAARISGLAPGVTIKDANSAHSATIHCQDLYPDSITYVQIYHGEEKLGSRGTVMPQTVIRFDTVVPQDQTIPLGEWSSALADGKYTLEVLTITPFNQGKPERLAHTTFVLDRGIHAPGMVSRTP